MDIWTDSRSPTSTLRGGSTATAACRQCLPSPALNGPVSSHDDGGDDADADAPVGKEEAPKENQKAKAWSVPAQFIVKVAELCA